MKTSLDWKIAIFSEYIKRWKEIFGDSMKLYNNKSLTKKEQARFFENVDWCSKNYLAIKDAETKMIRTYTDTGVKTSYPVIWSFLSKFQLLGKPTTGDIKNLKATYLSLKVVLGSLENKKNSIGRIKIEEYEKIKSLIDRLRLEYSSIDSLIELAERCEFLGLGFDWMLSTIALQLQEVAITLVAKQLGIRLDKSSVTRILGKQFEKDVPFKEKYSAFCTEIKRTKDVTLSMLPTDLRGMRTRVLHRGISPQTSETKLLADFTCSFLRNLESAIQ